MAEAALLDVEPEALSDESGREVSRNGQFVTFRCGGRDYGIDIMSVREIRSWSPTTVLPDQPHGACGVLDIRGEVVQVFDLNSMLGGGMTQATEGHVVIVVAVGEINAGLLADSVSDIIEVAPEAMREPPENGNGRSGMLSGLAKHEDSLVSILDLDGLLGSRAF